MRILMILAAAFLTACSATGPKVNVNSIEAVSPNQARIFVLRKSSFYGIADVPDVTLNGTKIPDLLNGAAIQIEASPGRHVLNVSGWGRPGSSSLSFTLDSGQTAYVLVAPNTGYISSAAVGGMIGATMAASGDNSGPYRFELLDPNSGLSVLSELTLTHSNTVSVPRSSAITPKIHGPEPKSLPDQKSLPDSTANSAASKADKLRELKSLLDEGVLTQAEFDKKKQEILQQY